MTRFFRFAVPALLCFSLSLPASAAVFVDDTKTYIPEIPEFVEVNSGWATIMPGYIDGDFFGATPELKAFADNFYNGVYLIFIQQWQYSPYNEQNNIDYDKKFWIKFVKPLNRQGDYLPGFFTYSGGRKGDGYYIAPMSYSPGPDGYKSVSALYDPVSKKFKLSPDIVYSSYPIDFSYVLTSSPSSNKAGPYPYFTQIDGKYDFALYSSVAGTDRHYNWWLGTEGEITAPPELDFDTDGDGKPDINIDTDRDGKPDLNVDTNNDGKPDLNVDTNGDKKPDINVDTNGDNFPDINIDTDGDKKPDLNVDTNGDGKPDTNLKPGGGTGAPGGGGDTSGDWFPDDSGDVPSYDGFPIFNPFDYDNYTPPAYNDPYNDYNPLEGLNPGKMPDPSEYQFDDNYQYHNPFINPFK